MRRIVAHYAICHCAVDFACVSIMLTCISPALGGSVGKGALAILAYDMFAFCLQLPLGALLDVRGRFPRAALLSFGLVAAAATAAFFDGPLAAAAATFLAAVGNALFHCAGGIDVLGVSDGHAAPSGVFISTGALGVFLGARAGTVLEAALIPSVVGLMGICALVIMMLYETPAQLARDEAGPAAPPAIAPSAAAAIALIALTVALRSYVGMVMAFPWKGELALAVAAIAAVVAGKAAGGFLADTVGVARASIVSLGAAAVLFVFSWDVPAAGIAATFLFNFTMPITLITLARLLPDNHGFAFGLASFSLAIGALPAFLGLRTAGGVALSVLSVASLAFLLAGLAAAKDGRA